MYFAKINEDNIVIAVIVADQEYIDAKEGTWITTDIEGISPKNYAGIGHTYDAERNAFYSPKPFESWILNEETCIWEAPIGLPDNENHYKWDEENTQWQEVFLFGEE